MTTSKSIPKKGQEVTIVCTGEKAKCVDYADMYCKIVNIIIEGTKQVKMYHINDLKY